MNDNQEQEDYGFVIFKPETPSSQRKKGLFFFTVLTVITLAQACYWVFANKVDPIICGMPFGMFTVVSLIILEFIALAALYLTDEASDQGGDR